MARLVSRLAPGARSHEDLVKQTAQTAKLYAYSVSLDMLVRCRNDLTKTVEINPGRVKKRRGHWMMLQEEVMFLRRADP